jgi:hypothetical protein
MASFAFDFLVIFEEDMHDFFVFVVRMSRSNHLKQSAFYSVPAKHEHVNNDTLTIINCNTSNIF